jgi:organic hydroperoxide reductase OsmC/OhrA
MALTSKVFTYQADVSWERDRHGSAGAEGRPTLAVAPPPEFPGGDGSAWSPEHLYLASLQSCTMLSALAHCAHNGIEVLAYRSTAHGEVARREDDGRYAFQRVMLTVQMRVGSGQAAKARSLTGKFVRDCFITASTTADVESDWRIIE